MTIHYKERRVQSGFEMVELVLNGIYLPIQLTDWLLVVVELPAHWLTHICLEKTGLDCPV